MTHYIPLGSKLTPGPVSKVKEVLTYLILANFCQINGDKYPEIIFPSCFYLVKVISGVN